MKFFNAVLLFLGLLLCVPNLVYGKTWAVLYTGIKHRIIGYSFEAGVARMYDTLINRNIPKENIITIMPNFTPYHMFNPFPGVLVHGTADEYEPGKSKNYFEHVQIDYNAYDLSQEIFFEILAGNKSAVEDIPGSGKVLESGPKDSVLVYFATITFEGYWLFSGRYFLGVGKFMEGFDQLRDNKRFGQLKIIFEADAAGFMFDDYMDTNKQSNMIGYSMAARFTEMYQCFWNPYLSVITGTCGSLAFFESLEKVLGQSNSDKLSVFDLLEDNRNYTAHIPFMDSPNLYGNQEVAAKSISSYYGTKRNTQTKGTDKTKTMTPSMKKMMADSIRSGKRLNQYVLDTISSAEERKFFKDVVSRIATKINERNSFVEEDSNQPIFARMSSEEKNRYDDVVQAVRNNCYKDKDLLLMATQPFKKLARLVQLNVPFHQFEEEIKSVCSTEKQ